MPQADLQSRCEIGQQQLMRTEYLAAEKTLGAVEADAWAIEDFDTLARVYMQLQEARRQKRQRCGEGTICLDLVARSESDPIDGRAIIDKYPHGQLLVAGWQSLEPARTVRRLALERNLYVETFLAAVFPIGAAHIVAVVPHEDVAMTDAPVQSIDQLLKRLGAHSILLGDHELMRGARPGDAETYSNVMALWERLHAPFLALADATTDLVQRIEAYRRTIRVDYACELAHQRASDAARELIRLRRKV